MIRGKDPSAVFLAETWADEARLKKVQRSIKFDNIFYVEKNSRGGGGLALYWKNSIDVWVDSSLMFGWILSPNTISIP